MSTAEMKLDILSKLTFIEDEKLLRKILNFISTEETLYYEFDEAQKTKVLNTLKKYEDGYFMDANVAEKDIEKWLNG